MASTGDDMAVFKSLEGDAGLRHQDLKQQVGGDCGGTMVDYKGNDNVCDDVGGSYVFVNEVNACDHVGDMEVENKGVVVGTGGNDGGLLAGTGKGGALHGELLVESGIVVVKGGEADRKVMVEDQVGLKDERGIGIEDGEVVVGVGGNDCEMKIEDQVCKKDVSGVGVKNVEVVVRVEGNDDDEKVEDQIGLKDETAVSVENEGIVTGDGGNDQDNAVEEDNYGLLVVTEKDVASHGEFLVETGTIGVVEDGKHEDQVDFDSTTKLIENRESQTDTDRELGERQEEVIEIMLVHELSESRIKSVEKNVLQSSAELGENAKYEAIILGADEYELMNVEGEIDVDAKLGESKETEIKSVEASDLSDILGRAVQGFVIISPVDFGEKSDTGGDVLPDFQISNGDTENSSKADSTLNSFGSKRYADINLEFGIQCHSDMPAKEIDATIGKSKVLSELVDGGNTTLVECSSGDSVIRETLGVVAKAKPFQFLIKIPRFDDDKLRKQMMDAQMLVEEKTTRTDEIGNEIKMKRAKLQSDFDKFEATKSDERAARRSVKLKRQEIDFIQDRINKLKNSISVIDINSRIQHMEYMIEHETNPLEEKEQLLREIITLRKLQEQISSNVYSDNEDNSPFTRIEPMEIQLMISRKELGDLKAKVSNVEAAAILLVQEYNGEYKKLGELQAQFKAANDVRQDAYTDFLGLERQLHEKSKHYWMYKDDAKIANDYALNGDREALDHLCTNQVETFIDLWNKNDEFREDYIRSNMRRTLRRLETSDGKSWVPAESKKKMLKDKTSVKAIPASGSVIHIVSGPLETFETLEEKKHQTEEELESARKADMLRQEEMAAKLKEKLRQEERAKAQEALERKRRNAEKAQMRAMLRTQKEAEQKEKEREKRRKKEKKNTNEESGIEPQTNSSMEESPNSPGTKIKISSQCNKNNKPKAAAIPPALRNRGKRQLFNQIMYWILGAVVIIFVLMVMNDSSYRPMKPRTKGDGFSSTNWQPI